MKLKPFGAVFTAVLLIAPAVFAQNTDQNANPSDQQNQGASQNQGTSQSQAPGTQAPSGTSGQAGAQGNVITGKVTNYTPNQSITVKESNGQTRQINLGANSQVSPDVKVGSRVKVSESTMNGQQMVRVEPFSGKHAHGKLPQTASNYPLMGLLGLLSLGAAAGIRIANRKLA